MSWSRLTPRPSATSWARLASWSSRSTVTVMATPLYPGYYKSRNGALRPHRQLRTSVFRPFDLALEPFFSRGPFGKRPELGAFLSEAKPPQAPQLLGGATHSPGIYAGRRRAKPLRLRTLSIMLPEGQTDGHCFH